MTLFSVVLAVGISQAEAYDGKVDIRIDDTDKVRGDDIIVNGFIFQADPIPDEIVQIRILDPDGNVMSTGESIVDSETSLFEGVQEVWKFEYVIDTSNELEEYVRYILEATYDDKKSEHSFTFYPPLEEQVLAASPKPQPITNEIPDWVREVFSFWVEKQISDAELISAIEYLIEIGMIQVSK